MADGTQQEVEIVPFSDLTAGLVLAVGSLATIAWLIPAYVETPLTDAGISAAFFPAMAAWIIFALAAYLIVSESIKLRQGKTRMRGGSAFLETAAWIAVSIGIYFALVHLGFLVTGIATLFLGAFLAGARRWYIILPVSVGVPIAISIAVWFVFTVELP